MMKKLLRLCLPLTLIFVLALPCDAVDDAGAAIESYAEEVEHSLFDLVDDDTRTLLEHFGLGDVLSQDGYDISLRSLVAFFGETLKNPLYTTLKNFFVLLALLVVLACVRTLLGSESQLLDLAALCVVVLKTAALLQPILSAAASMLRLSADFMKGYLPVYAALLAFSGSPAAALSYQTLLLALCETVSSYADFLCVSLVGGFLCLCIAFSMSDHVRMPAFLSSFNKAMTVALGLAASVFTGVLSVKGIIASAVDTASGKSVRFLMSSLIPIVGSAMSDAYSSVLSSIHLIKGSVALIGIVVLLALHLPVLLQALLTQLSFWALGVVGELIEQRRSAQLLQGFSMAIKFTLLLCVFELFVLLIATGLMLQVKGGV